MKTLVDVQNRLDLIRSMPTLLSKDESKKHQVEDVSPGGVLQVQGETYLVNGKHKYTESPNCEWFELQLTRIKDGQSLYVEFEHDDELEISITTEKLKLSRLSIDEDDLEKFDDDEKGSFRFRGAIYNYEDSGDAKFHKNTKGDGTKFYFYDFESEDEKSFLGIEEWSDNDYEVSVGHYLKNKDVVILNTGK